MALNHIQSLPERNDWIDGHHLRPIDSHSGHLVRSETNICLELMRCVQNQHSHDLKHQVTLQKSGLKWKIQNKRSPRIPPPPQSSYQWLDNHSRHWVTSQVKVCLEHCLQALNPITFTSHRIMSETDICTDCYVLRHWLRCEIIVFWGFQSCLKCMFA